MDISEELIGAEFQLAMKMMHVKFGSRVEYVYNPLKYAFNLHHMFVAKYCTSQKKVLFLGMNPGPWGMMQNGIPFGEVSAVKDFLSISGEVGKPEREHPARPVLGLDCKRSEVSGKRFWALASLLGCGEPERFFRNCYVYNYFPLCLLDSKGKNITPPELKADVKKQIDTYCDEALFQVLDLLGTEAVIGIGRFAEKKAQEVVKKFGLKKIRVVFISHPSPRNPASNKDWLSSTRHLLLEQDLLKYFDT